MEDDTAVPDTAVVLREFQSTSPVWRTTVVVLSAEVVAVISIHVPRVEDDCVSMARRLSQRISIHVPRVEDDV